MLDLKYSTMLKVAAPLMVSSFIQSIILLTDAAFISRYDTMAFDAVGNGGLLYVTVYMALVGMGDGAQIIIARRIGQNNINAIGKVIGTSLLTNFLIAISLFALLQYFIPEWLISYSKNKQLANMQIEFIQIRSYALFFAMVTLTINAFFIANGKTLVVLIAAVLGALTNVGLDYCLVFGNAGFPEMGLSGAAWASTISDGVSMLIMIICIVFSPSSKEYKIWKTIRIELQYFSELFKVGSPMMLQGFFALATWTLFFTWIEQMGTDELTISQNVRSVYFLSYVPIWGFAATTKTYVSQYLGNGHFSAMRIIRKRIQLLTLIFLLLFFHGALLYPNYLIEMVNPSEVHLERSAEVMRFVAVSILLYGFVSVYFQTISGSGNTMITFGIELTCILFYTIAAYLLIKVFVVDIFWIWSVEYIYFGCMGLLSYFYLKHFKWQNKVI
jgi:MATE family multidrug resistance protein